MFLGKFATLADVYTYFLINSLELEVRPHIDSYFSTFNQFEYTYVLEYCGNGIYSLTCGYNLLVFDLSHILTIEEIIEKTA